MPIPASPLPPRLPELFSVASAAEAGVTPTRLRAADLSAPRRGVRARGALAAVRDPVARGGDPLDRAELSPDRAELPLDRYERALDDELRRIREFAQVMTARQFFSHRSAALLWGAPVPYEPDAPVHASVLRPVRSPRAIGVVGHGLTGAYCAVTERAGVRLTTPACTWVQLVDLPIPDLVALGDFFVRRYREGHGRPDAGRPPLATIGDLHEAAIAGRRRGGRKLLQALALVREDSWSPRESTTRLALLEAGLPEPELNGDVYDGRGVFLACIDLLYRRYRVGVEYQGEAHWERYSGDVDRLDALRADGWEMIEVTKTLAHRPGEVAARVERALRRRGWPDAPGPWFARQVLSPKSR
jgi:hypothetical protein